MKKKIIAILILAMLTIIVTQQLKIRHLQAENEDLWYDGAASAAIADTCKEWR